VKRILSVLILLLLPNLCMGATFDDHVIVFYPSLVCKIEQCGIQGPLARELAQYAIIRQLHENGLDRPPSYSIPGISTGGWNEDILRHVLKKLRLDNISLTKIHDSDGVPMFVVDGLQANHLSAVTIAYLYDYYLIRFEQSFTLRQREVWQKSKVCSYILSCHPNMTEYLEAFNSMREERIRIIQKCNRMYGPGSDRIEGTVNRLQPIFNKE
jgi:hypothetical protein